MIKTQSNVNSAFNKGSVNRSVNKDDVNKSAGNKDKINKNADNKDNVIKWEKLMKTCFTMGKNILGVLENSIELFDNDIFGSLKVLWNLMLLIKVLWNFIPNKKSIKLLQDMVYNICKSVINTKKVARNFVDEWIDYWKSNRDIIASEVRRIFRVCRRYDFLIWLKDMLELLFYFVIIS